MYTIHRKKELHFPIILALLEYNFWITSYESATKGTKELRIDMFTVLSHQLQLLVAPWGVLASWMGN